MNKINKTKKKNNKIMNKINKTKKKNNKQTKILTKRVTIHSIYLNKKQNKKYNKSKKRQKIIK